MESEKASANRHRAVIQPFNLDEGLTSSSSVALHSLLEVIGSILFMADFGAEMLGSKSSDD
jgi:hypothetical protein